MMLDEFFDYKNLIMETICCDKEIVHLVTNSAEAPVPNHDLPYRQVFPFEYLPDTVDDAQTFICFDVDIARAYSKTLYVPVLYVWAFTHRSLFRLPDGGVRLDRLSAAINRKMAGSMYFGMGRLDLYSVTRFLPIQTYAGRALTYRTLDWNRTYEWDRQQDVPGNRKENTPRWKHPPRGGEGG